MTTKKYTAEHALFLRMLQVFERNFQIAIRTPQHCVGSGGVIFDYDSKTRYFTSKFEAVVPRADLIVRTEKVVDELAHEATEEMLRGFYSRGVRRSSIMLILAAPQHPPVVFTTIPEHAPEHPGQALATIKLIVNFPKDLPLGLPASSEYEAADAQTEVTMEKFMEQEGLTPPK